MRAVAIAIFSPPIELYYAAYQEVWWSSSLPQPVEPVLPPTGHAMEGRLAEYLKGLPALYHQVVDVNQRRETIYFHYQQTACMKSRYEFVAKEVHRAGCVNVLEIGGGSTPLDTFLDPIEAEPSNYMNIAPTALSPRVQAVGTKMFVHLPVRYTDYDARFMVAFPELNKTWDCVVIMGVGPAHTPLNKDHQVALKRISYGARFVVLESSTSSTDNLAVRANLEDIISNGTELILKEEKRWDCDFLNGNRSMRLLSL